MKRSYEDRVRFSRKTGHKSHKPNRNAYGFHKTRRHYQETIEERFIDQELDEEIVSPDVAELLAEYED